MTGLALATEKYSSKFFANNARPAGILSTPGVLADKAKETLKRSWSEGHGGENAHKTALSNKALPIPRLSATPEEAQNNESRAFQRVEIANIFGVPARMVDGDAHAARKYSGAISDWLLNFCVHPWLASWQAELKRKLFAKMGSGRRQVPCAVRHSPIDVSRRGFTFDLLRFGQTVGLFDHQRHSRELEGLNPITDGSGDRCRPTCRTQPIRSRSVQKPKLSLTRRTSQADPELRYRNLSQR